MADPSTCEKLVFTDTARVVKVHLCERACGRVHECLYACASVSMRACALHGLLARKHARTHAHMHAHTHT